MLARLCYALLTSTGLGLGRPLLCRFAACPGAERVPGAPRGLRSCAGRDPCMKRQEINLSNDDLRFNKAHSPLEFLSEVGRQDSLSYICRLRGQS